MEKLSSKASLLSILFVVFIDFLGIGLIYPLITPLIFNPESSLLPSHFSSESRGLVLGVLIALNPLANLIGSPLWGTLSDRKGRKSPLQISLYFAIFGYLLNFCGFFFNSLILLLISRLITGFASGNLSIIQAAISDVSSKEEKAKNFGLFGAAFGLGFTAGPLLGGVLSQYMLTLPVLAALVGSVINLVTVSFFFQETRSLFFKKKIRWDAGLFHFKKLMQISHVRPILSSYFLFVLGWCFHMAFMPLYLTKTFHFGSLQIGYYLGTFGTFYALSTGLFIRPLVSRFKPETLCFWGNVLAGCSLISILWVPSSLWLWPLVAISCFFIALVSPTVMTLISNASSEKAQGETMGLLNSLRAVALILAPLSSGVFVGRYPALTLEVSGALLIAAGSVFFLFSRKKLLKL